MAVLVMLFTATHAFPQRRGNHVDAWLKAAHDGRWIVTN